MSQERAKMQYAFSKAPLRFMRRITLRWLQGIFKSFPADDYQFLGNDDPNSKIKIVGQAPWAPEEGEHRPVIVLSRGPMPWSNPGMGAGAMVQSTQLSQDVMRKTGLLSGVYSFNCISKVGDEAEHIAWTVSLWFMECIELLARCGFHSLGPSSIGTVSPAPDALVQSKRPEWLFCPVTVPHSFQYSWQSTPEIVSQVEYIKLEIESEIDQIVATVVVNKE